MITGFIFLLTIGCALSECPKKEVAQPCQCFNDPPEITCKNATGEQLRETFKRISKNIKNKHFNKLAVDLISSAELPLRATHDLTFGGIEIGKPNNPKLIRIHSKAFEGTASRVTMLSVRSRNLNLITAATPYNVFDMLNSFVNLEHLVFVAPKVFVIPKSAFKSLAKLKFVKFGAAEQLPMGKSPDRVSVGDDAFYQLKNIQSLDLSSNRINKLSANALRLQKVPAQAFLNVFLNTNKLNSSSFTVGSLAQFNRRTSLSLFNNQIDVLPKNVFQPFLDANPGNVIETLASNPINCSDCRNYWLVKDQVKYRKRVKEAFCGGRVNDNLLDKKFDHCKGRS